MLIASIYNDVTLQHRTLTPSRNYIACRLNVSLSAFNYRFATFYKFTSFFNNISCKFVVLKISIKKNRLRLRNDARPVKANKLEERNHSKPFHSFIARLSLVSMVLLYERGLSFYVAMSQVFCFVYCAECPLLFCVFGCSLLFFNRRLVLQVYWSMNTI